MTYDFGPVAAAFVPESPRVLTLDVKYRHRIIFSAQFFADPAAEGDPSLRKAVAEFRRLEPAVSFFDCDLVVR